MEHECQNALLQISREKIVEICQPLFSYTKVNFFLYLRLWHVEMLSHFCRYFLERIQPYEKLLQQHRIQLTPFKKVSERNASVVDNLENQKNFYQATQLSKYSLVGHSGVVELSHKEFVCLALTAKRQSAKVIAQQLDVSFRTVEFHLSNARAKLGCNNKAELIKLFEQSAYQKVPLFI